MLVGVAGFEPATPTSRTKPPTKRDKQNQQNPAANGPNRSFSVHGKAGPPQKPPGPEKRRAGPAATGHGPNRKRSKSRSPQKTTPRGANSQALNASLAVYDGQQLLGLIARTDSGFDAYSVNERFLSSHPSLKSAADAVAHGQIGDAGANGGGR